MFERVHDKLSIIKLMFTHDKMDKKINMAIFNEFSKMGETFKSELREELRGTKVLTKFMSEEDPNVLLGVKVIDDYLNYSRAIIVKKMDTHLTDPSGFFIREVNGPALRKDVDIMCHRTIHMLKVALEAVVVRADQPYDGAKLTSFREKGYNLNEQELREIRAAALRLKDDLGLKYFANELHVRTTTDWEPMYTDAFEYVNKVAEKIPAGGKNDYEPEWLAYKEKFEKMIKESKYF